MNNKILSQGQVMVAQHNIQAIEKELKRPVPGGMLDYYELSDHVLSGGEILVICENINRIYKKQNYSYQNNYDTRKNNDTNIIELVLFFGVLLVGAVMAIFNL